MNRLQKRGADLLSRDDGGLDHGQGLFQITLLCQGFGQVVGGSHVTLVSNQPASVERRGSDRVVLPQIIV